MLYRVHSYTNIESKRFISEKEILLFFCYNVVRVLRVLRAMLLIII
jgi:hypothetical protein